VRSVVWSLPRPGSASPGSPALASPVDEGEDRVGILGAVPSAVRTVNRRAPSMPLGVTTARFDAPIAKAGLFGLDVLIATNRRRAAGRVPDRSPSRRGCGSERRTFGVGQDWRLSAAWRRRAGRSALCRCSTSACLAVPSSPPCCRGKPYARRARRQAEMPTAEPWRCSTASVTLATATLPSPAPAANNAGFNYAGQLPTSLNIRSFPVFAALRVIDVRACAFAGIPCA
jgi:hypothetical protein